MAVAGANGRIDPVLCLESRGRAFPLGAAPDRDTNFSFAAAIDTPLPVKMMDIVVYYKGDQDDPDRRGPLD